MLDRTRPVRALEHDIRADVAIVGGGIAGVSTLAFLLERTELTVALVEADRIAHGATGHNAGQLVSYFERPFHEIAEEYGITLAADGQREVMRAWDLIAELRDQWNMKTPWYTFDGYAGIANKTDLQSHLLDNRRRVEGGLDPERIFVAEDVLAGGLPDDLARYATQAPRADIQRMLETKDEHYLGVIVSRKGVMNSARFCEEAVSILLERWGNRVVIAEHTPVETVVLHEREAELTCGAHSVRASRVVLCTNGFERFRIENRAGADIDPKFHHLVRGSVGYMAAFVETSSHTPAAISYLPLHLRNVTGTHDADPYYYLTRRPHGTDGKHTLVSLGGPEALMDDTNGYSREHPYPDEAKEMLLNFVQRTYKHGGRKLEFAYLWHGLMGYTPNGIRLVGAEPCNPVLLYNLGCNGVGILPSVSGGYRIARLLAGDPLPPSIFDPKDKRCEITPPTP